MKGIDWVIDVLNNVRPDEFCSLEKIKELCLQAKEMENQEKKVNYSEKELFDFADYLRKNNTDFWELANNAGKAEETLIPMIPNVECRDGKEIGVWMEGWLQGYKEAATGL